jgi:hypothetical protein
LEAKRQAEKLNRYRIKHHNGAAILWRFDPVGWALVGAFPNTLAAEDYLLSKLPTIESEL